MRITVWARVKFSIRCKACTVLAAVGVRVAAGEFVAVGVLVVVGVPVVDECAHLSM